MFPTCILMSPSSTCHLSMHSTCITPSLFVSFALVSATTEANISLVVFISMFVINCSPGLPSLQSSAIRDRRGFLKIDDALEIRGFPVLRLLWCSAQNGFGAVHKTEMRSAQKGHFWAHSAQRTKRKCAAHKTCTF